MKPLRNLFQAAGLGHLSTGALASGLLLVSAGVALSLTKLTGLTGVGLASFVVAIGLILESLKLTAQRRYRAIVGVLPEAAELIASGVASGEQLGAAICTLAKYGPKQLRESFLGFEQLLARGYSLEQCLRWLQIELGDIYADQLIHLLLVSSEAGGYGLVENLNHLAGTIREQAALDAEVAAKQGWVIGTAKLGIAAPWLIVLFLNQRLETHNFYASPQGSAVLIGGLAVCVGAYLLILRFARLPHARRVLNVAQ